MKITDDELVELVMLRIQVRGLQEAVQQVLDWMQGMTIVRGGKRERLRKVLLLTLENSQIKPKRNPGDAP